MKRPIMVLIAGSNGSGKSTLSKYYGAKFNYLVIDPDAYVKNQNKESSLNNVSAGKKAIAKLRECIEERNSFIAETTLSGKSYLKLLKFAKAVGFRTEVIYISLDSCEQAIGRVAERVKDGGHDIPVDAIERRYQRSFDNLEKAIAIADRTKILLNSYNRYSRVATITPLSINLHKKLKELPKELHFLGELKKKLEQKLESKKERKRKKQNLDYGR